MNEKYYVYSSADNEIKEYSDLELFLEEVVDEDYLEELYNDCFDDINIPVAGKIGTGTILRKLDKLRECLDDEIMFLYEDLVYELEHDDIAYFYDYRISNNKYLLIELKGE